jgi:hypothetical protein
MDTDEVNLLVKSFYGEDLGYNSNDEEYEYYCKSTAKKVINNNFTEQLNGNLPPPPLSHSLVQIFNLDI